MKKNIKLAGIFAASALTLAFSGCSNDSQEQNALFRYNELNAKASLLSENRYSGIMQDFGTNTYYPVDFSFSPESLIQMDNKVYSKDIAKFAACISADAYDTTSLYLNFKSSPASASDNVTIYKSLGFADAEQFRFASSDFSEDINDISNFVLSHKNIKTDTKEYELIIAAIQGTNNSIEQWTSNFDIGADSSEYTSKTGFHPEWTDKNYHKGFYVASSRVNAKINDYVATKISPSAEKIILITGHSRGAAIANILGAIYEKSPEFKSFTYTFATPNTTVASDAADYKTIFNIVNKDDVVRAIPQENLGFSKNGKTLLVSISQNDSLSKKWYYLCSLERETITGFYESSGAEKKSTIEALELVAENRSAVYTISSDKNDRYCRTSKNKSELDALKIKIDSSELSQFANLSIKESTETPGSFELSGFICPQFYFNAVCSMITNPGNISILKGITSEKYLSSAEKLITAVVTDGIVKSHCTASYYLLADNLSL